MSWNLQPLESISMTGTFNGHPRPGGSSGASAPIGFASGPFAGHTLRGELEELQKADLGRKFGQKDRRPLDPPPIVRLRLVQVFNPGTMHECESEIENYDGLIAFGLTCHVDLFPVYEDRSEGLPLNEPQRTHPGQASIPSMPSFYTIPPPPPPQYLFVGDAFASHSGSFGRFSSNGSRSIPSAEILSASAPCITDPAIFPATSDKPYPQAFSDTELYNSNNLDLTASSTITSPDIVAYFNGYAITESSNCTSRLVGTSFAHAVATKYHGVEMFIFVFPVRFSSSYTTLASIANVLQPIPPCPILTEPFQDIAVQVEGTFVFRYRIFDVCAAATGERGVPMLAECFGGPFKVWSTKEFPGLRPSTELTKHVSALGIRTHIRMNERKRRRPCPAPKDGDLLVAGAGRKPAVHSAQAPDTMSRLTRMRARYAESQSTGKGKGRVIEPEEDGGDVSSDWSSEWD